MPIISSPPGPPLPVSVANGGTGVATLGDAGVLIGNGTGAVQVTGAGTSGQVLTSNGAGTDPTFQAAAAGGTTENRDVTTAEVVNTTTETTVYSYTVPGNTIGTNNMLRLTLIGDGLFNNTNTDTLTIRVKYGATTIFSSGGVAFTADPGRRALELITVMSGNNATNAQVSSTFLTYGGADSATGSVNGANSVRNAVHNAIAIDSTANADLVVTYQWSVASANNSAKAFTVQLEQI